MYSRILVAVDGSEHSLKAARVAAELARQLNATELRVVVAFDPLPSYLGEPNLQAAINARLDEAQRVMERALQVIGPMPEGVLRTEILEGPAAEAILQVAETHRSDLIVMGSRGLGRFTGLLLGSQSQKVVQHASCPVLIVR
ncbi:MAG: universal stress protein [Anaerolineales bacterium]